MGNNDLFIKIHVSFFLFCLNDIALNCRSLFVPYFKYLMENSVHYLTVAGDAKPSGSTRKKKAKIQESDNSMFLGNWHLRALILSSLHKCFLYDTGSHKFLDSSNFQVSPSFISSVFYTKELTIYVCSFLIYNCCPNLLAI